ncbi:MAG: hypothetical protein M3Z32_05960 [Acidobacteriota bacterium]|nr:hypothetical protein [Acidobacteriota bacterium]
MNLKISGLGAEPKKVMALGVLVLLAIVAYFYSRTPSGPGESTTSTRIVPTVAPAPAPTRAVTRATVRPNRAGQRGQVGLQEFRPSLKPKKGEEAGRTDIDPTLRLDLLEKLQNVGLEGGKRSLFEASQAPVQMAKVVKEPPKVIPSKIVGPQPPPPVVKPAEPVAPPVPLKFYGFVNQQRAGAKRAFFLDGEDIIVATEGQLLKNRYKIVRIGVNSAVVEDTQFKNHQQTLPLIEEQTG